MASIGGWLAAAIAAAVCLFAWRSFSTRMEGVMRACHELRGPLTAVRLGLDSSGRSGGLSEDRVRAIDLELCKATLVLDDLARAGSSSLQTPFSRVMEVDLGQLVADSVEAWRSVAEASRTDLRVAELACAVPVFADRFRVAQAIGNLIANAIEHGGGKVEVRGSEQLDGVRIEVIDSGPGLPAPVNDLACGAGRRRNRAERGRRRAGRGRGLAIALAVAQAHGGRLAAAPSERGARLVLELPAVGRDAFASGRGQLPPESS
jgi:signal transduction histidine kinase